MDIIQELIQYIEPNEQSGALLLTGKWGCGKTHLINRLSSELDKERYGVAIISVFGIDSIDNLTSTIKQRVFYARTNITQETEEKATKARKIIGKAYDVLKEYISVPEAVNTVLSINPFDFMPIEREIGKNRQLILVFDDIERSKLDIQELLGAINEYVEGKKIKTILIADEEKIGKKEYAEFKEKVISRTVRFTPNYAEVIKSIIANYEETAQGYKDFLFRMMGTLVSVFEESKSENLRTFKCLIIDFERVFNHIKELKIQDAALTEILYAFAVTLFKYKGAIGFSQNANPKNEERLSKALQHHYEEDPLGPLKKWIEKGIWQAEEITDHFTKRYCQKEPTDEIKFLYWDFWNLNDSIVKNGLPIVLEKAYRGELCCDDLVSLLVRITIMKKQQITHVLIQSMGDYFCTYRLIKRQNIGL